MIRTQISSALREVWESNDKLFFSSGEEVPEVGLSNVAKGGEKFPRKKGF